MSHHLQSVSAASSAKIYNLCNAQPFAMAHIEAMDEKSPNPPNFLRHWRTFRKLSQADLAAKVGTTGPMINHLENGNRALSHKWLVRLAPALGTTPGFILDHNPFDMPRDLFEIWNRGDAEDRKKLVNVAEAMIPYRAEPRR